MMWRGAFEDRDDRYLMREREDGQHYATLGMVSRTWPMHGCFELLSVSSKKRFVFVLICCVTFSFSRVFSRKKG